MSGGARGLTGRTGGQNWMILLDGRGHLVSTEGEEDLHGFARRLGLDREWYQEKRKPHYDLTTKRMQAKAVAAGAEPVSCRELVERAWWNKKQTGGEQSGPGGYAGIPAAEI